MNSEGHKTDPLAGLREKSARSYVEIYGSAPQVFCAAPGRVNLIGEHTDYNDGFVLPAAIDRYVVAAASPRDDDVIRVAALDFDQEVRFALSDIVHDAEHGWSNYVRGVAAVLQEGGYRLSGMDLTITSNVPVAAGLSSSAALELAVAYLFEELGDLEIDGVERALLCQRAENEFVGMQCGIMDQYIVSLGQADHALLIDCRSLGYELVPVPSECSIVICDTKKSRGLVDSAYNERRRECETGAQILGVEALRDVSVETFERRQDELDETVRKRCRHVVTENQRTLDAVETLRHDDLDRVGDLMKASHVSLRDDYEVSCVELDIMVEAAWRQEGTIGARMTGAGFGGCTVSLVEREAVPPFVENVSHLYHEATGIEAEIYICRAARGVHSLA